MTIKNKPKKPRRTQQKKKQKRRRQRLGNEYDVFERRDGEEEEEEDVDKMSRRFDRDALQSFEYKLPSDFVDEDIDEEMAFDDEDLKRFGNVGGGSNKSLGVTGKYGDGDGEDVVAAMGRDEMDLSEMLGDDDDDNDASAAAAAAGGGGGDDDDDDDEEDDDARHMALLNMISDIDGNKSKQQKKQKKNKKKVIAGSERTENVEESEFAVPSHLLVASSRDQQLFDTVLNRDDDDGDDDDDGNDDDHNNNNNNINNKSALRFDDDGNLQISSLMEPMKGESGFSKLRRDITTLRKDSASRALAEPLTDVAQDRLTRQEAYSGAKKDLKKWNSIVKRNRMAETLKFPLAPMPRHNVTSASMAATFKPTNSLESDLDRIMNQYGLSEKNIKKSEAKMLAAQELTPEEIKEREAKVAKMRNLMFYNEMKMKRIARIKSKSYRRLRKRMKEKNKLSIEELERIDPELARAERAKQEKRRIRERMTLKHKNMSKWVRRAFKHGKEAAFRNEAIRDAYNQHHQLGQELRRKMDTADSGSEHSDGENAGNLEFDSDDGELTSEQKRARLLQAMQSGGDGDSGDDWDSELESDDEVREQKREERRQRRARKIAELEAALERGPDDEAVKGTKGIFAMKFMQRAAEKERAEAKRLLADLDDDMEQELDKDTVRVQKQGDGGDGKADDGVDEAAMERRGRRTVKNNKGRKRKRGDGDNNDDDDDGDTRQPQMLPNTFQMSSVGLSGAKRTKIAARSAAAAAAMKSGAKPMFEVEQLSDDSDDEAARTMFQKQEKKTNEEPSSKRQRTARGKQQQQRKQKQRQEPSNINQPSEESEENPWQQGTATNMRKARRVALDGGKRAKAAARRVRLNVDDVVVAKGTSKSSAQKAFDMDAAAIDDEHRELVQQAFSVDTELEEEFRREKEELSKTAEEKEAESNANGQLPGWGSWAGEGIVQRKKQPKKRKINKPRHKPNDPTRKDAHLPNVIISEKRDKKLARYQTQKLPHSFGSIEQFERAQRTPLGPEWNTMAAHSDLTMPEVITKPGQIIEPIEYQPNNVTNKPAPSAVGEAKLKKKQKLRARRKHNNKAKAKTKNNQKTS